MISHFFNLILYQPLFNALILLYKYIPGHDFGIAVIILTVLIRLILFPLMAQSIKSQKILNELQPKIQEIQKKHANDKEQQGRAMMELYKQEKFNPFGGCLPLLIQFPLLIALYQVFYRGFNSDKLSSFLYPFIQHPGIINATFLGLINLDKPNIIFAFIAGALQFLQTKMVMPAQQQQKGQMSQFSGMMQKQMLYFMPIFTVFILWKLPAAIGLYWIVTTVFSIIQQYIIYSPKNKNRSLAGQKVK
jgi:YidC/Oxa1 family membrane protein insertase